MKLRNLLITGFLFLGLTACGGGSDEPEAPVPEPTPTPNPTPDPTPDNTVSFYKGADISWITEMEKDGKKFYNASGQETDGFQLMKELGMKAIRLRVWVNPEKESGYGNYCNQADVVAKAKRAKEAGMEVMIDFHYSDFFADPSRQSKPAAWEGKSPTELKTAVADHTTAVLKAIKEAGVTPKWIQIGNETRNGMLWPEGNLWDDKGGWKNYVSLSNAGYDAAKKVFGDAIIIVHLDNAWGEKWENGTTVEWGNLNWWFDDFKAAGGKFDMIGLSHYPENAIDTKWATMNDWEKVNTAAIKHIQLLANTYNCKVMVCEVGVKTQANETIAAQVLTAFMSEAKKIEACAGVFYWEPQVYGSWKPAYYTNLNWNAYDMGAFTSTGKPSKVMDAFKD